MKRLISIEKTFLEIRKIPIEVSFQKVEKWVSQHANFRKSKQGNIQLIFKKWFSEN